VFIEHPPENSMESFCFTSTVLDEGTTFIFGSWICVANGLGGFNGHLADSRKLEASTATRSSDLDKLLIASMSCCSPITPRRSRRRLFSTQLQLTLHQDYSDRIQTDLRRLHSPSPSPTWRRTWTVFSRLEMREPPLVGGPPFLTTSRTPTKSTC
jgi:hypothetical protein